MRRQINFDWLDFFSKPYPLFNNKGSERVTTNCGFFMTLMLITLLFLYGSYKLGILIGRNSPNI